MAALAHGSVLLSLFGPIGPILVWVSQRRKSAYASFHALQAMGYQMAFFWIGLTVGLLVLIFWMCLALPLLMSALENNPDNFLAPFAFEMVMFIFTFLMWGIYALGGIVSAVMCLMKKDFRYPWLGKRLEAFINYDPATGALDQAKEEQFVAAMSHASAILFMLGALSPLTLWVTQKDRSPYLRFQGLQAVAYQLLALAAYFGFMFVYVASFVLLFVAIAVTASTGIDSAGPFVSILLFLFILVMMLMWLVFLLAIPTYHLFAMIAAIQILKGRDYRYPWLGNFLARRMKLDEAKKEA